MSISRPERLDRLPGDGHLAGLRPRFEGGVRRTGFTVLEFMLTSLLMTILAVVTAGAWSGLGRPSVDAVVRCRIHQEAEMALESLACDLSGALGEQSPQGARDAGRLVGRRIVGSQLQLCFEGEPLNGAADWATPDTLVTYDLQGQCLTRSNQQSGTTLTVARCVQSVQWTELPDGIRADLTISYRGLSRTFTFVARDP
jgi:type II secretory pathway component PulJ